ncbi:Dynein light chain type 1 family protein [Striga hermonthica]|uniref:Dynein light chain type 1 family protein n=1 Tax=Striga hermonthica TaxID=68872 RepID=A0A9N7REZ6_STRHE|nr:Dynein light chain type 1 family protein [Striga hermonthica]
MDPPQRKPRPEPSSAAANHHLRHQPPQQVHPLPDPAAAPPSSTIQNISHRFSKLYASHRKLASKPGSHPQPDPFVAAHRKDLTFFPVSDSSCTTLTKSSSQKERNPNISLSSAIVKILEKKEKNQRNYYFDTKPNVDEKSGLRKPSRDRDAKKDLSFVPSEDILRGLERIDQSKRVEEGVGEGRRRSSVSCLPPVVNGGRRRSFCNSQVELADFLSSSGVKVVSVDMPPFMQIHAVDCARKAYDSLEKFTAKTLAFTLKKEFDGVYGPAWHCIVGTGFGSFVTHSVGGFMYFSLDHKLYILLFKTTVHRAE